MSNYYEFGTHNTLTEMDPGITMILNDGTSGQQYTPGRDEFMLLTHVHDGVHGQLKPCAEGDPITAVLRDIDQGYYAPVGGTPNAQYQAGRVHMFSPGDFLIAEVSGATSVEPGDYVQAADQRPLYNDVKGTAQASEAGTDSMKQPAYDKAGKVTFLSAKGVTPSSGPTYQVMYGTTGATKVAGKFAAGQKIIIQRIV